MPRLTPGQIARVRAEYRIVHVLDRCGVLDASHTAASRDFMISCPSPNHDDRTPSCAVHPATDKFFCFGCGAHGDVFALVTELTGIRSLSHIADLLDAGGTITAHTRVPAEFRTEIHRVVRVEGPELERTSLERVLACNAEAWKHLSAQRPADRARLYLARRGIDLWPLEAASDGPLAGTTPTDRDGLTRRLTRSGFTVDETVDAGWTIRTRDGAIDRFRNRVLFPVRHEDSHVLGVIGRDLTGYAKARYLNTPRTVAFHKGDVIYRPIPTRRDPVLVVCEGPIDALAVTAARADGHAVAIAPSGTALTEPQARRVAAMTSRPPVLCADGDDAGSAAARARAATFERLGRATTVVDLPPGHDPASFLSEHGALRLNELIRAAAVVAPLPVPSRAITV